MPIAIADWRKRNASAMPKRLQDSKMSQVAPSALRMSIAAGQVMAAPSASAMPVLASAATV